MSKDLEVMETIQKQKARDIDAEEQQPLDPEHAARAKHKRFSIDVVDTPTDPLR